MHFAAGGGHLDCILLLREYGEMLDLMLNLRTGGKIIFFAMNARS